MLNKDKQFLLISLRNGKRKSEEHIGRPPQCQICLKLMSEWLAVSSLPRETYKQDPPCTMHPGDQNLKKYFVICDPTNMRKFMTALISECCLCFYLVHPGNKHGVLQYSVITGANRYVAASSSWLTSLFFMWWRSCWFCGQEKRCILHTAIALATFMFQFHRNLVKCHHWTIAAYAFIHQTCTATSWQKTNKGDIILLYTFFQKIWSKCLRFSFPWPYMAQCTSKIIFQETASCDGILLNTLQASSMLPYFTYMSTKLVPTKTSESHPLWMI